MPFLQAVLMAWDTIRVQKLKSFFTLVGVTISVMFLIGVVSIVQGMSKYIEEDFAGKFLGVNTFNLRRCPDINTGMSPRPSGVRGSAGRGSPSRTATRCARPFPPAPAGRSTMLIWGQASSVYKASGPQVLAEAATPEFFKIKDLGIVKGRAFTEQDDQSQSPVIVIGEEIARDYFPNLDPLGREIRINKFPFTVIGVLEKQGTVFGLSSTVRSSLPSIRRCRG